MKPVPLADPGCSMPVPRGIHTCVPLTKTLTCTWWWNELSSSCLHVMPSIVCPWPPEAVFPSGQPACVPSVPPFTSWIGVGVGVGDGDGLGDGDGEGCMLGLGEGCGLGVAPPP